MVFYRNPIGNAPILRKTQPAKKKRRFLGPHPAQERNTVKIVILRAQGATLEERFFSDPLSTMETISTTKFFPLWPLFLGCSFLLTGGSFLLTIELYGLQLYLAISYLQLEIFCLQLELLCLQWESLSESREGL